MSHSPGGVRIKLLRLKLYFVIRDILQHQGKSYEVFIRGAEIESADLEKTGFER